MALDSIFLMGLAAELSSALVGAKVERVQQPARGTVVLTLKRERRFDVYIGSGAGCPRMHITTGEYEKPQEPPMFCMLLRKHLTGARVISVTQPELERALEIRLNAPGMFGEGEERKLFVELAGRTANLILTDGEGIITDCLYRVGSAEERRAVVPGMRYRLPPPQDKLPTLKLTDDEIKAAVKGIEDGAELDRALVRTFLGLSPLTARETAYLAAGAVSLKMGEARERGMEGRIAEALIGLRDRVLAGRLKPIMVTSPDGAPFDFSWTPVTQYGPEYASTELQSFSELLETFCGRRDEDERRKQRSRELIKTVRTARDRVSRRLTSQREELAAAAGREALRECGDLITSNLHAMKKGQTELVAEDYYSENGGTRTIKLDPLKTPQQNAARYYKEYARKKSAEAHLTERIAAGETELSYLESVLDELERAESAGDLAEIRAELLDAGLVKEKKSGKKEKRRASAPMKFRSTTGFDIRVGRNNLQNDALTLRESGKNDVWLHVKNRHGSHVVITTNGAVPDEATVLEAAALAVYFSEARDSGKTPVDVALIRHVKKPSGARPGMVIYTDYRTVIAEGKGTV